MKLWEKLKKEAEAEGISVIGVGDLNLLYSPEVLLPQKNRILKDFNYVVTLGVKVNDVVLSEILDSPTRRYLYHYREINRLLDHVTLKLSLFLEKEGYKALPIPASVIVDWEELKGEFSHKLGAFLAGIGWIGKSSLLIHPKYGAKLRYGSILTTSPLDEALPKNLLEFSCGDCVFCINSCPAGAIEEPKGDKIIFSKEKCLDKLREFAKKSAFGRQYICGICVKVCR